ASEPSLPLLTLPMSGRDEKGACGRVVTRAARPRRNASTDPKTSGKHDLSPRFALSWRFHSTPSRPFGDTRDGDDLHPRHTSEVTSARTGGDLGGRVKISRRTGWRSPTGRRRAGGQGFEPRLPGPEPGVLPLHHPPKGRAMLPAGLSDRRSGPEKEK